MRDVKFDKTSLTTNEASLSIVHDSCILPYNMIAFLSTIMQVIARGYTCGSLDLHVDAC
jgi:hypothetical protein